MTVTSLQCLNYNSRYHRGEVVVRETGQHDLQSEDTSFVPLEEERGPDATPQILHEKGTWLEKF